MTPARGSNLCAGFFSPRTFSRHLLSLLEAGRDPLQSLDQSLDQFILVVFHQLQTGGFGENIGESQLTYTVSVLEPSPSDAATVVPSRSIE